MFFAASETDNQSIIILFYSIVQGVLLCKKFPLGNCLCPWWSLFFCLVNYLNWFRLCFFVLGGFSQLWKRWNWFLWSHWIVLFGPYIHKKSIMRCSRLIFPTFQILRFQIITSCDLFIRIRGWGWFTFTGQSWKNVNIICNRFQELFLYVGLFLSNIEFEFLWLFLLFDEAFLFVLWSGCSFCCIIHIWKATTKL